MFSGTRRFEPCRCLSFLLEALATHVPWKRRRRRHGIELTGGGGRGHGDVRQQHDGLDDVTAREQERIDGVLARCGRHLFEDERDGRCGGWEWGFGECS